MAGSQQQGRLPPPPQPTTCPLPFPHWLRYLCLLPLAEPEDGQNEGRRQHPADLPDDQVGALAVRAGGRRRAARPCSRRGLDHSEARKVAMVLPGCSSRPFPVRWETLESQFSRTRMLELGLGWRVLTHSDAPALPTHRRCSANAHARDLLAGECTISCCEIASAVRPLHCIACC